MKRGLKLTIATVASVAGLYLITFFTGTNRFYLGLIAAIWGGLTIGEWLKSRYRN